MVRIDRNKTKKIYPYLRRTERILEPETVTETVTVTVTETFFIENGGYRVIRFKKFEDANVNLKLHRTMGGTINPQYRQINKFVAGSQPSDSIAFVLFSKASPF